MGIGNAGMWGPLATTATRNLPPRQAGAGAGVYNTTRTMGSVLGSAAIAAIIQSRMSANRPVAGGGSGSDFAAGQLPAGLVDPFSTAMAQTILVPAAVMALGVIAVMFLTRPSHVTKAKPVRNQQVVDHAG